MIPRNETNKAKALAKRYGIGKLYVFGSSLHKKPAEVNDYDFAVSDINPGKFFEFYGKLIMALSKNVDLIDLSGRTDKFSKIVLKEGKLIYDQATS